MIQRSYHWIFIQFHPNSMANESAFIPNCATQEVLVAEPHTFGFRKIEQLSPILPRAKLLCQSHFNFQSCKIGILQLFWEYANGKYPGCICDVSIVYAYGIHKYRLVPFYPPKSSALWK